MAIHDDATLAPCLRCGAIGTAQYGACDKCYRAECRKIDYGPDEDELVNPMHDDLVGIGDYAELDYV